jgi:hypothetical protein
LFDFGTPKKTRGFVLSALLHCVPIDHCTP